MTLGAAPAAGDPRILLPPGIRQDAVIYVRALVSHPMYTGMSRDEQGALIREYYIKSVEITYGGQRVARFEWTSGISRDPYVAFPLRATHEAPLHIAWTDTKGKVYTQTAAIAFGG
ncbi:MAG TPA: thiosulfate oxidation carrier complex protein SoxZ [Gemmatimonadaceae bacterium]|jgi:sulfur-oxidizing protein SoxZ